MNKTIKTDVEIKEWMEDKLHNINEKFKDFTFNTPIKRERLNDPLHIRTNICCSVVTI